MTMPAYETLTVEPIDGQIAVVRMNRPDVSNALNTQMGLDLVAFFEDASMDPGRWRCLVLTGTGDKAFCAGGDLKERNGMTDAVWQRQHLIFERMARALITCPIPLIAAVNGAAYGGGCEIAACCDFIYAAEHARFALTEVRLGIIPGAAGTQNMPRAMGERRAKELLMTARPFTAQQGLDWGFVNQIFPGAELVTATLATAREIAVNAPLAVRQVKHSIHRGMQMSIGDGMTFEIEAYNRLVPTADRSEGVRAFNEKRPPGFTGT
jgi:enoyl-CoA hydratase/carnithine racemase